jgi:hypothetical protein
MLSGDPEIACHEVKCQVGLVPWPSAGSPRADPLANVVRLMAYQYLSKRQWISGKTESCSTAHISVSARRQLVNSSVGKIAA